MPWSIIRRSTDDDESLLHERAKTFAARHNIDIDPSGCGGRSGLTAAGEISPWVGDCADDGGYLERLWHRVVARALREPAAEGVSSGYVGYHCD